MSVELEIQDGSPRWWLSHDIWTIPGNDPEGTPGLPIVGQPCYVCARVHNKGTESVKNATVKYYWANPAVGFDRNTATHIGDSFVTLNAGETKDVLCIVTWFPLFINNGHECVVAEAFHPDVDPLPVTPVFNVPTDRHVAQRNLTILKTPLHLLNFSMSFEIYNSSRLARSFTISTRTGNIEEIKDLLPYLGRDTPHLGIGNITKAGFVAKACPDEDEHKNSKPVVDKLEVGPGASVGLSVVGKLEGEIALLHVVQEADGIEVGGLSILVTRI